MSVKLLTEHHLEFLRFKRGCTGSSEYTLVKILEITLHGSNVFLCGRLNTTYMHQVPMSLKLMAILKDAASSSQDAPSRLANKELQDKVPAEFRGYWPKETTVKRPIQGERRKHFQALSDSLSELEIPEEWQKSSSGDQFLVTDTTSENGNRILIFATDHSFIQSFWSKVWYGDGTFHVAPQYFYQLYTLHGVVMGQQLPLVYCQKAQTYIPLCFTIIKSKLQKLGTNKR